jgi:cathepsin L
MKLALLLVAFIAATFALTDREYQESYYKWQTQYGKVYASLAEHRHRFSIYRNNLDFINAHDSEAKGFTVALNQFADQTIEEFSRWACGMNVTHEITSVEEVEVDAAVPTTWDWRTKGAVTGVKNQGQCGSCWSFSTTGSTEGVHFLKTGRLVSLSEQNLVDCSVPEGNQGCNGGLMDQAFSYIIKNKGIDTEASYPYTATGPNQCRYNAANNAATLSSYQDVPRGSEASLLTAVYKNPTSVAIDASHQSFQFYSGGVYYEPQCSSVQLDHGVLAVGFGVESSKDYWLVKNSWGASWGSAGYIKMSRNRNNNCGIATAASYPIA